ncbi:uncharacterized protein ColSpa_03757 [Colletotrichum spaethianum]|uniref:Fucose-specific lectin n=1 Tax=Colletotrichum spaethianum TaxID=700344 RepID=A0AA37L857_9PEZI|nr:uncharacterized protein ColSpa_03757 [Colletotrichum spaethianum]GKT43576.1 hypothetical protein ColSpa_03757 [Colletotrichum spaethianum]
MTTSNNNAASGYYGGLEVDSRPGHGGEWGADDFAKFRVADQNNLPEVHNSGGEFPEVSHQYGHDYSMMQAVQPTDGSPAATYQNPSYQNEGLHETGYYVSKDQYPPEVVTDEKHEQNNPGTICGVRKKVFWVVLAIALFIVVGAALRSKNLMMSSWNSSTNVWSSAIANRDSNVKAGTPISNSLFWHSNTTRDVRIYYLNDDNQVAGQINGNPIYGMTWDKSGVSDTFTASPNSQLLSNGIYTPDSYLSNLHSTCTPPDWGKTDWVAVGISTDFGKPAEGTGLFLIPVYTKESTKRMCLFYTTESGSLTQLTLTNDNDWTNNTLPTTLETNTTITAFSSGYNNTNLVMHVLATQANKPPVLTTYNEGEWSNAGEISTMSGDDRPVKITANSAGRVYGLVQRSNDKVEIVEWEWIGGTTYNKIGVVDTVS